MLTFTTLWAFSADDRLMIFSYFSQKTGFDISCKLFPFFCFLEKKEKYFKMLSAENFTQSAKR